MTTARPLVLFALGVLALGCTPKKIPGTDINDNDDTRAILNVIESYRLAVEKKDAPTIVMLADQTFRDDGGTTNPDDDLDYETLGAVLADRLQKFQDVKLEINVRKIEFDETGAHARAVYTWSSTFKLPGLSSKSQTEGEIKQMAFIRADKKAPWKIVSGI